MRWASRLMAIGATLALAGCASYNANHNSAEVYQRYSDYMTLSGRFRNDPRPEDAPFTNADLARNFEKVVFEPEEQLKRFYSGRGANRRLSKWRRAIRYQLFGDGVRASDRAAFQRIAATLSRASGLSISEISAPANVQNAGLHSSSANMRIFIVSPKAREIIGAVEQERGWYDSSILRDWVETLNPPCFALFDASTPVGGEIVDGAIFVKAELENPLRDACFVEEFTQSLGLVFDHDDVRPSIFNDDQEFIALTDHDLALLSVLYDKRLSPGMTRAEAGPIARRILSTR